MDFDVELKLSKKELNYLYALLKDHTPQPLEDVVELYKTTFNKVEHEMIANEIFELLDKLEQLADHSDDNIHDKWCDKLWCEEPDGELGGIMIKRDPKMWNWSVVSELQEIVSKLEEDVNK
jgi:hypothetical protein